MSQYRSPTFEQIYAFLEREFKIQYREKAEMFQRPLEERVEQGVAIAGLRVIDSYPKPKGKGNITVFETDQDNNSKFRTGDYFFCHRQNQKLDLDEAMAEFSRVKFTEKKIHELSPDRRTIHLPGNFDSSHRWCLSELPDKRFPLTTWPCLMGAVLESQCETGEKIRRWLRLAGKAIPFTAGSSKLGPKFLTQTQRRALHRALKDDIALIQGPPGTGKTFLIAEIVAQMMKLDPESRILACCFSHTAIDNVLRAVFKRDPSIGRFRVGRREEDPPLPDGTDDEDPDIYVSASPGITGMTAFKAGKPWTRELGNKYKERAKQLGDSEQLDDSDRMDCIRYAWDNAELDHGEAYFDVVIIDEASQMTIPIALMAIVHGSKCILVGDEKQLPPVAQVEPDFAPSIFDHMLGKNSEGENIYEPDRPVMLDVTHRMNQEICTSPSKLFYGAELHPREDIRARRVALPDTIRKDKGRPDWLKRALDPEEPVLFVSIDHDTGDESNEEEADVVGTLVAEMLGAGLTHEEGIAVVCAHRKQNSLVRRKTKEAVEKLLPNRVDEIDIENLVSETVERIQGQERDVIIVSLIGSDPSHLMHQWTFSHCPRRFNVSITRPKSKLIVVGSPHFFYFLPDVGHGETLERLKGVTAIKRWYLDRVDKNEIAALTV